MKEIKLNLTPFGEPVLRQKARKIKEVTDEHRALLSKMAQLMYEVRGVGLAAPQVGINEALIVVDAGSGLYKVINPVILKSEGTQSMEEGCFSVPGVGVKVKRSKRVVVEGLDENGKPLRIEAEDLLATVFQHEIDHLHGTLIIDHSSVIDSLRNRKKIEALKKKVSDEKLSKSKGKSSNV
ncbi:MAG TPA: peptide deformylase [Candidatus Omnitrophota bacterium]|nr:peptide deformylase [Candidatus Omnitrophota bacterium]HPT07720.1 peptide deformylase [Candidatus Omnitrophota bacterium]